MRPHYTGPVFVIARNKGGAYIVCELDGSVYDRPIAAFRLIPYLARQHIPLPDNFLDTPADYIAKMKASESQGDDGEDPMPSQPYNDDEESSDGDAE